MSQQSSAEIQIARSIGAAFQADISRIVKYAPSELIGREAETLPPKTPTRPQLLLNSAVFDRLGALTLYLRSKKVI